MREDELKEVVVQAAELLEYFKRQAEAASQASQAAVERLAQAADMAPAQLRTAATDALGKLSGEATQSVRHGVQAPLEAFEKRLLADSNRINASAHQFSQLATRLQALERRLLLTALVVTLGIVLAIAATAGALWQIRGEVRDQRIRADLLRAYNSADVAPCGDGLCARVDPRAEGVPEGYVRIRRR